MRNLITLVAAMCFLSSPALTQDAKPLVYALHPAWPSDEAVVVPSASPMRLISFDREVELEAVFGGRFTLSGKYLVELSEYGGIYVTIWPDKKSRDMLPYWRSRGHPEEIGIGDPMEFVEAVISKDELQELESKKVSSLSGRVSIIADEYSLSISCDVPHFSASFVSVAKPATQIAAFPTTEHDC